MAGAEEKVVITRIIYTPAVLPILHREITAGYTWQYGMLPAEAGSRRAGKVGLPAYKENHMLWTVSVILIILWLLGLVSSHTMGGFIHVLLVIAIIVILVNVIRGPRRRGEL